MVDRLRNGPCATHSALLRPVVAILLITAIVGLLPAIVAALIRALTIALLALLIGRLEAQPK